MDRPYQLHLFIYIYIYAVRCCKCYICITSVIQALVSYRIPQRSIIKLLFKYCKSCRKVIISRIINLIRGKYLQVFMRLIWVNKLAHGYISKHCATEANDATSRTCLGRRRGLWAAQMNGFICCGGFQRILKWLSMGFENDSMGFKCCLMGFNSDLMGYIYIYDIIWRFNGRLMWY